MPPSRRRPPLALLVAATATGPFALNMLLPSMPGLQAVFAADYGTVQLAFTFFLVGLAVAQLAYGPLSDRFGRRPTLLAGLALFIAGSLVCLLAPTVEVLIGGRLVQAVGGCAGMVVGRAVVRDLYGRDRAASMIAYITMAMVVAPMLAPTIGGFVDEWLGWRAGFAVVLAAGAAVLAAAQRLLPETHHARQPAGLVELLESFGRLARIPAFAGYALQCAFGSAVFFSFLGGAPYVMIELMGRPAREFGLFFMVVAAAYMVGNFTAARISARVGADRMIRVGTTLTLAGTAAFAAVTAIGALVPASLFGIMAVIVLGNGMSLPNGLAGAVSVDPARAGAASGFAGFLQMALGAGAATAVGALLAESAAPLAAMMVAGATLAVAAHALGVRWAARPKR